MKHSSIFIHQALFPAIFLILFLAGSANMTLFSQDLSFTAGRVRSVFAEGEEQTVLENNALVENDEIQISAQTIRLSGESNRFIESSGSVYLLDKENSIELRADFLSYDSELENLLLEGNAEFLDREDDILVRASFIEQENELVLFQLNVQIIREDLVARAEYVRYFEDAGRLELSGSPRVFYRGDEYSAELISIFTEDNEIILDGEVRGQISDSQNSEDQNSEPQQENGEQ